MNLNSKTIEQINSELLVKLEIQKDNSWGTGFFISKNIICTALHTIEDVVNQVDEVKVFWKGKNYSIKKIFASTSSDLAFILLKAANNKGWGMFDLEPNLVSETYFTFGFTQNYNIYGEPASLSYTGTHLSDNRNRLMAFSGDKISPGMSGGPIIRVENGLLAGMLTISRNINAPMGGRGIDANTIVEAFLNTCPKEFFTSFEDNSFVDTLGKIGKSIDSYNRLIINFVKRFRSQKRRLLGYTHLFPYTNFYWKIKNGEKIEPYLGLAKWICEFLDNKDIDYFKTILNSKKTTPNVKLVVNFLDSGIMPFSDDVLEHIGTFRDIRYSTLITGSSCLRQRDLFESKSLLIPFEWETEDIKKRSNSLVIHILEGMQENQSFLVLADPGMGKTTLTNSLFYNVLEARISCSHNILPLYVNLRDEVLQENIGSEQWINDKLVELYGRDILRFVKENFNNLVLILDSLDEYLAGGSKRDIDTLFHSYLFKKSLPILIACRGQFFEKYLKFHPVMQRFYLLHLYPWNIQNQNKYATLYLNHFGNKKYGKAINQNDVNSILREISDSLFLKELSSTPLYLNMLIELYGDAKIKNGQIHPITNLVELYIQFIEYWLNYEREKSSFGYVEIWDRLGFSHINELLSRVSWNYYDDALYNRSDYTRFSRQTLEEFLILLSQENKWKNILDGISITKLTDFILARTFLLDGKRISFIHKSFQEYFVSKYMFDLQISMEDTSEFLIEAHAKLVTPEVSEFLKGQLLRVERNIILKRRIYINLRNVLLSGKGNRIVREQIAYHIGLLNIPEAVDFLHEYLKTEKDYWIVRGITIGLSFSGDESELHKYVERMYTERSLGGNTPENDVNLGWSLTFFGDQPYDDLYPDKDQHLPSCKNTVTRLIYQLSTEIDRPSWRTNLYTLVDLYLHREESLIDYLNTMRHLKDTLEQCMDRMILFDPTISDWKEIPKMKEILKSISSRNGGTK